MTVRAPTAGDVAAIGALAEEVGLFPAEIAGELLAPFLEDQDSGDVWLVAEDGDRLVGLAYTVPEKLTVGTYNMLALGTAELARGSGVGKNLVARTEEILASRSARVLIVETSSDARFDPARHFYANCGYREVARIPGFWDEGDDKIVYLKQLPGRR